MRPDSYARLYAWRNLKRVEGIKPIHQGTENTEQNAREHLALRFDWARTVAKMRGEDMPDVLSRYTDLHARIFGKRVPRNQVENDTRWQDFIARLKTGENPVDVALEMRQANQAQHPSKENPREFFGPFRYDYDEDEKSRRHSFRQYGLVWY